jgi:dynactin complex subunit
LIIQEITAEQTNAEIILRETDYSIKKIADKSGASRTTYYNHGQLLKRYIEHVSQISLNSNPYAKIEALQSEKRLLQEQISKMMQRDVDIELLKVENKNLSSALTAKNEEIKRLEKHVMNLNSKLTNEKAHTIH